MRERNEKADTVMAIKDSISKLRTGAHLSQAKFASLCGVTPQSVQKWGSGAAVPGETAGHVG